MRILATRRVGRGVAGSYLSIDSWVVEPPLVSLYSCSCKHTVSGVALDERLSVCCVRHNRACYPNVSNGGGKEFHSTEQQGISLRLTCRDFLAVSSDFVEQTSVSCPDRRVALFPGENRVVNPGVGHGCLRAWGVPLRSVTRGFHPPHVYSNTNKPGPLFVCATESESVISPINRPTDGPEAVLLRLFTQDLVRRPLS